MSEGGAWREAGWPAEAAPPEEASFASSSIPSMEQMELMESAESVAHECEHCGARLLTGDFDHTDDDAFAYAVDHHVSGECCKVAARVARELAAGTFTLRPRGDPLIAFCASKRGLGQLAVDHLGAIAAHHDVDELGPNLPGLAFATALHAVARLHRSIDR